MCIVTNRKPRSGERPAGGRIKPAASSTTLRLPSKHQATEHSRTCGNLRFMISRNMRVNGELGLRIVLELGVCVQEAAQPGDLGGEVHDDDLHLDVEVELEDVFARLESLRAS